MVTESGVANALISSYLSNRTPLVAIDINRSTSKEVKIGIPQSSILGPLLFLIYINVLEQVAVNNNIDLTLFADDSTFTAYNKFDALNVLRNEITEIKKWCETNRLQLNSNKSKTLIFSSAKNCFMSLNSEFPYNFCESTQFLGVIVDIRLNFKDHVCRKLSKLCGFLIYTKKRLKHKHRIMFNNYYIKPIIQYGQIIYGST